MTDQEKSFFEQVKEVQAVVDEANTQYKSIAIGDILSITTGRLVSHDGVGGLYNILDWMTGDSLFTHQLTRASDVCEPVLKELFPEIGAVRFPAARYDELTSGNTTPEYIKEWIFQWVDRQGERLGEWHDVPKLADGLWESREPIQELRDMLYGDPDELILEVENDQADDESRVD